MNRKHIIMAMAAVTAVATIPARGEVWTLDQCVAYALDHNLTVRARQFDADKGRIEVTSAKDAFLPTVSAGASESFDFGRSVANDNMKVSANSSSFSWNVNAQLPLFDGLKSVRRLQTAKLSLSQMLLQTDAARDDVTLNVITSYLQALLEREMTDVARQQVEMSQVEVSRQESLVESGKNAELDLVQARAQLAQDELTLVERTADYDQALLDLRQLLLLPVDVDMEIAPLEEQQFIVPDAESVYRSAMAANSSILARRKAIEVADSRIAEAKTGWIPTLSFGAGIGSNYTYINRLPSNSSFSDQMKDNFSKTIGFSLSIPIFDGLSTRNAVNSAKVDRMMADLELEEEATRLYKTISQAYTQAESARKKSESAIIARDATKAALDAMTLKYNYGKANATEYEQAKTDYISACSRAVQARYEYIVRAKVLEFYNTPHAY